MHSGFSDSSRLIVVLRFSGHTWSVELTAKLNEAIWTADADSGLVAEAVYKMKSKASSCIKASRSQKST